MKPKLYVETSVVSYLTGRPSRDLVTVSRQELTREWWEHEREDYDLFVSAYVIEEAGRGDPEAARLRLAMLLGVPEVTLPPEARALAEELVEPGPIPAKAALDAYHIAAAVAGGADYLLTWNFKHLANAALWKRIDAACRLRGYEPPVICTPEELDPIMSLPDFDSEPARDEIIEEVRAIRDALAAEFGYDLDRLFDQAKRWEAASDRAKIAPSPKRLSPAESA